jgi:hypothetical protein
MAVKKYIILASILTFSVTVKADDVLNTFEAGEPIVASDVNENFVDLQNQINTLKTQLESQNTSETPREFVGITSATTNGDAGSRFGIDKICSNEYPGTSICHDHEVLKVDPELITADSWVEPSSYDLINNGGANTTNFYKIYKYINNHQQIDTHTTNCKNWTNASDSWAMVGANLKTEGLVRTARCINEQPIACCK